MKRHIIRFVVSLGLIALVWGSARAATYGKPNGSGGQSPSAVAITGGTITGTNPATRTVSGLMAATDKAFDLDSRGWQQTQYQTITTDVPGVTRIRCERLPPPILASDSTAVTGDGALEGGGASAASGASYAAGASIFQNTTGGNWGLCERVKYPANASSVNAQVGVESVAGPGTDIIFFGIQNSISATNFVWKIAVLGSPAAAATSATSDTNWHDVCVTDDGTTVRFRLDAALVASTTTRTQLVATAMQRYLFSATSGAVSVTDSCYSFVVQ